MIKEISKGFPKYKEFSVKLTLHKLERGNPVRHPLPTDHNSFCFFDKYYCSLEEMLERHKNSQIDGRNIYIIGSPFCGYRLALGAGLYVRGGGSGRRTIRVYRSFADIIID